MKKSPEIANALVESISRKRVVNILNYINFKEDDVVVNLRNLRDGTVFCLKAAPEPCRGEKARLTWSERAPSGIQTAYEFADFLIDKGPRVIVVGGTSTDIDVSGITILLPEHCQVISRRRTERFGSASMQAILSGSKSSAVGSLKDFGGGFLKVRVAASDAGFLLKERSKLPLRIALHRDGMAIYEGAAVIKRRVKDGEHIDFVLALVSSSEVNSDESRETALDPALIAICRHPLSDRIVRLHVAGVSYNSFVVNEDPEHIALFPGLVIPEMRIDFGAGDSAQCVARVAGGRDATWAMSIIDMPISDQRKLFSFVEKETGQGSGVSTVVDPDDLIEFFFEAGFIYPDKYAGLTGSRKRFKEMLSRLYINTPSIAQHFVRYERGAIVAHICMVRFYERAWVVQHHMSVGSGGAGSAVLAQIFRYIYHYRTLPSTGMDYTMAYYRPENKFPDRVFGGLARSLNARDLCSIDAFAYLHLRFDENDRETAGKSEWQLGPSSREDLLTLVAFYEGTSGGLMFKAFGFDAEYDGRKTIDLDAEFKEAGLRRRKSFFSLRRKGELKAVMMALDSDAGLNMSNLMKCIHVFVIDGKNLPFKLLTRQLRKLSHLYEESEIPILILPSAYLEEWGVAPEKIYNLLVFHISVGKRFIEFTERLTNRAVRRRNGALNSKEGEGE